MRGRVRLEGCGSREGEGGMHEGGKIVVEKLAAGFLMAVLDDLVPDVNTNALSPRFETN